MVGFPHAQYQRWRGSIPVKAQTRTGKGRRERGKAKPSDNEEEVVANLTAWLGDASQWNVRQDTIRRFKKSPMWQGWTEHGFTDQMLLGLINRLKQKKLSVNDPLPTDLRRTMSRWGADHIVPRTELADQTVSSRFGMKRPHTALELQPSQVLYLMAGTSSDKHALGELGVTSAT